MSKYLEKLEYQMSVLQEDKKKTSERMLQIMGAIKVVEFLINDMKTGDELTVDEVKTNGSK